MEKEKSGGIGFCGALQITFIVLKLCKVIDWSWWWVFAPTWIPLGFVMCIILIITLAGVVSNIRGY